MRIGASPHFGIVQPCHRAKIGEEGTYSFVIDSARVVKVAEEVAVFLASQEAEFDNLEVVPEVAPVVCVALGVTETEMAEDVLPNDVRRPGIMDNSLP